MSGPVKSLVLSWFSLMPIGWPSSSKRLMNHSMSCSGMKRLVSSMKELVCGDGMFVSVCRNTSSWLIFLRSRERTMAAKLPLRGHPCAKPSGCLKCRYVPLSVLYQQRFGSL